MNIHEYQAKELLAKFGSVNLAVQGGDAQPEQAVAEGRPAEGDAETEAE